MRIVRYFFVGATAAAVDIGIFTLLAVWLNFTWFFVAVFSFLVATAVNYRLSIRHVFTSGVRFVKHREIMIVYTVSAIGLAINQGVLWLLIEKWAWNLLLAKMVATCGVFLWNYSIRHNLIFKPKGNREEEKDT